MTTTTRKPGCYLPSTIDACGGQKHPLYSRWRSMLARCYYRSHKAFNSYGGRGIEVCERWHNFNLFVVDITAMGGIPTGLTMDRIDPDGDYTPSNIRFVDRKAQTRNRRDNIQIETTAGRMNLVDWAELVGLPYLVVYKRWRKGTALDAPYEKKK